MTDCPNAEIRDLLPDLVHGTLGGAERARVESHVATCADCASELALLRAARRALSTGVPAVNVERIASALPSPPRAVSTTPGVVSIETARREREQVAAARPRFAGWRRAAAVILVAAGATTVAVMRSDRGRDSAVGPTAVATVPSPLAGSAGGTPTAASETVVATRAGSAASAASSTPARDAGLSMAGGVSDLDDAALVALLGDLDRIDATPATEPTAVMPEMTGEGSE